MTHNSPASDKIPANKKSRRTSSGTKISSENPGKSNNNVLKDQKYEIVTVRNPSEKSGPDSLSNRIITRDSNGKLFAMYCVKAFEPKKPVPQKFNYLKEIVEIYNINYYKLILLHNIIPISHIFEHSKAPHLLLYVRCDHFRHKKCDFNAQGGFRNSKLNEKNNITGS